MLTAEEAQIAERIRRVRTDQRISQRLAASRMGLSRDQLKRIERGEVSVRFFPGWNFCQFADANPLWLAFGDPEKRFGFVACANATVDENARFLDVLKRYGERYRTFRFFVHESWFESGSVFSDKESVLNEKIIALDRRQTDAEKKTIARKDIKRYLIPAMAADIPTWETLRMILRGKTQTGKAKANLARYTGVSLAAVSQWRSGASAPTADKTLRVLRWVRKIDAHQPNQKNAPEARKRNRRKTTRAKESK